NQRLPPNDIVKFIYLAEGPNLTTDIAFARDEVPLHLHRNHDELIHVLEGSGTFRVGKSSYKFGPQSIIYIPEDTVHGGRLDDQAHYFANSIRQASPEYDKIFDYLRGPGGMLTIANHTGDGFLDHFFTKTATHVACLNLPGISDISGVNGMRSLELFAETRDK